jgi:transposase
VADPGLDRRPRAPACRRRAQKNGGAEAEALGRSRGGFGTKIHAAVNGLGLPVKLVLTPGQGADVTQAETLLHAVPLAVVIGDKGFDSQKLVAFIETRGGEAVIPSRQNSTQPRDYDRERYKDRNLVERFWSKVKHYRRVATRYEKTARNFLAFVHIASIMVLLQ